LFVLRQLNNTHRGKKHAHSAQTEEADPLHCFFMFFFTGASPRTAESPRPLLILIQCVLTQLNNTHRERSTRTAHALGLNPTPFTFNWFIKEATPTSATRKVRRAVERESDCVADRHGRRGWSLVLYKILFYFAAFVHESSIPSLPPSSCAAHTVAILLQYYCALYNAPPTALLYAIHHTILLMAISCKGQGGVRETGLR